ncbi:MAG: S24 family peptidase [Bacteroidales bacterium]|nr:S24 family peptidase [Bacteroidales bacterium]
MATIEEIKEKVGKLVMEKGMTYNSISISLGKNPSYLQKFVKEKSPKRLDEKFRRDLAFLLNVDEQELTDVPLLPVHMSGVNMVAEKITSLFTHSDKDAVIDMIDATACCGDGIDNLPEKVCGQWKLPMADFKSIVAGAPKNIKMLRVQGDSMQPTINEGDFVWVDISNNFVGSDGIYLIRMATGLAVKRLQSGLNNIVIKSDNSSYSDITAEVGEIKIVGKVVHILNSRRL